MHYLARQDPARDVAGSFNPNYKMGCCDCYIPVILTFQFFYFNISKFYFNVHNFMFHLIFISIHIYHGNFFFFLFIFFRSIGSRANKSQGQVQRSHSILLVFKFYVLILIYFRPNFMEIFLNIFIWFFFFFLNFLIFLLFC